MSSDNQALREQIAQAIAGHHIDVYKSGMVSTAEIDRHDAQRLADAVLPVVQAHEKALRDELRMAERQRDDARAAGGVYQKQYRKRCAALSSLRDAVAQLAAELDSEAQRGEPEEPGYENPLSNVRRDAARRLRSLLPQEGQPEKGAD